MNRNYLKRWAHRIETRLLIPGLSMAMVFAPLRFHGLPHLSLTQTALAIGLAFVVPHLKRMFNPNVLLLGVGTAGAAAPFMNALRAVAPERLFSDPAQLVFALAPILAAIAAVEFLTSLHWHNNNVSPLTKGIQLFLQAAWSRVFAMRFLVGRCSVKRHPVHSVNA